MKMVAREFVRIVKMVARHIWVGKMVAREL